MSKIRQEEKKQPAPYGTVAKLQWLRVIAKRSEFSRTTLAACCVIADMADSKSGVCWPSFSYLADACGTSIRHIKKSINQATENNLVTIAEHGNRVRSNRYRINLDVMGSDLQDTTQDGDPQDTRVVISRAEGGDLQVPDVVIQRSPESIHPTEHQAREGWDRSFTEGGVRSLRADRPTLSRQAGRYDEFWEALGKRSTVYESEQLITELIADGVDYADIVDGAKRWRAYNKVTGGKNAASPLKWLEKRKWLDGWKLLTTKPKSLTKGESLADGLDLTDAERDEVKRFEVALAKWNKSHKDDFAEIKRLDEIANLLQKPMDEHFNQCQHCQSGLQSIGGKDNLHPDHSNFLCDSGKRHFLDYEEAAEDLFELDDGAQDDRPTEPDFLAHKQYLARNA